MKPPAQDPPPRELMLAVFGLLLRDIQMPFAWVGPPQDDNTILVRTLDNEEYLLRFERVAEAGKP
jgi:hypothetical protein